MGLLRVDGSRSQTAPTTSEAIELRGGGLGESTEAKNGSQNEERRAVKHAFLNFALEPLGAASVFPL